jgi:hypothetical protein
MNLLVFPLVNGGTEKFCINMCFFGSEFSSFIIIEMYSQFIMILRVRYFEIHKPGPVLVMREKKLTICITYGS